VSAKDIARVYASSLVELGQEKKILADLEAEMKLLADLIAEQRDMRLFLASPGITREKKKDFIEKIFTGKLSEYMNNFLKVLIDNDRQSLIAEINEQFSALLDDINKRQRVSITTAAAMDASTRDKLTSRLKEVLKKDIILNEKVNPEILGGIVIRVGDTVIDGSLVKDLKNIRSNLLNSKVRSEVAYED
jgi:F-type H+-transporting ATPase subunit delta